MGLSYVYSLLFPLICAQQRVPTAFVRIKGSGVAQALPFTMLKSWKTWTFESNSLTQVEDHSSEDEMGIIFKILIK